MLHSSPSSSPSPTPPTVIRTQLRYSPHLTNRANKLGLYLRRCDTHEGAITIYHLDPNSHAATHTALRAGCDLLAVNEHKVSSFGSAKWTMDLILHYLDTAGQVDIVACTGVRPRGSLYVVAKATAKKRAAAQSAGDDGLGGRSDHFVEGLELEEKADARHPLVRIVSTERVARSGFFNGLKLNKGDCIHAVDGIAIRSIRDVRRAFAGAVAQEHTMIPILTYNVFRRLKTTVMCATRRCPTHSQAGAEQAVTPAHIDELYQVHEKLGEGSFAVVKKATHKTTGNTVAIKIVNRSSLNNTLEIALKDEISILKLMNHENIMRLENVVVTINHYYLVAEYLEGGELFDRIVAKSTYTESEAREVCHTLFAALQYMHGKGIVHRDLKPENLLLQNRESDAQIKIADFGFAKEAYSEHSLTTLCGTPGYVAPEILGRKKYGTKADIWSMGVVVFILLCGYPPFEGDDADVLSWLTVTSEVEYEPFYWDNISTGAKDLVRALLVKDPAKRASAEDVLSNHWMKENANTLKSKDLCSTQAGLKKYLARKRFKTAVYSILFVNTFSGEHAVFSGKNKHKAISILEDGCAKMNLSEVA